ncbi:putative quinone oxidoreductase [Chaetomium tenue]|uniref:Quinone oxidoreductase n=1 Tax=Chaetomium tenue TaxID=1854479 RepID=A0ACB7PJI6_9PEZI|nr:putative quinone oxidoreductase [Chaetomium globosum]
MASNLNRAAWLHKAGTPLEVGEAPMPTAGPNELVIRNAAVAINPLDCHMQSASVFVQQWPSIFGCDVAGVVHEVGSDVHERFKVGDRVIGHAINLTSGRPQDGAFALYTTIPASKAAILPSSIPFTTGVVVPFALEAAVCALSVKQPGTALPNVPTPALGLPYPSLTTTTTPKKTLIIYGGSSSVGSMATQLATAAGIHVLAIASARNFDLCRACGAAAVFDYHDASFVDDVVQAATTAVEVEGGEFVGIFDAVSTPETYANGLAMLERLGGSHLACVHPPPEEVPEGVKAGMIFAVDEVATPVWRDYVTDALAAGRLKCLPSPLVVGKGLEFVQVALEKCVEGVSAAKLVVEL